MKQIWTDQKEKISFKFPQNYTSLRENPRRQNFPSQSWKERIRAKNILKKVYTDPTITPDPKKR